MLREQGSYHLNLAPLMPEVQEIVRAATHIYLQHLGQWCTGMLIHGSALKGGYIPGCSDVDLQVYLEKDAFDNSGMTSTLINCIQRLFRYHRPGAWILVGA